MQDRKTQYPNISESPTGRIRSLKDGPSLQNISIHSEFGAEVRAALQDYVLPDQSDYAEIERRLLVDFQREFGG